MRAAVWALMLCAICEVGEAECVVDVDDLFVLCMILVIAFRSDLYHCCSVLVNEVPFQIRDI